MSDDDLLKEGKEKFTLASDAENDNREAHELDMRFGRNEEQWDEKVKAQREREGRPCLVINKLTAFSRQVVNDARQNKPSIKVHPADSGADSSDWMDAHVVDLLSNDQFKARYGESKTLSDWDDASWHDEVWREGNDVLVAEWWHRVEAEIKIAQFLNTQTGAVQTYAEDDIKTDPDIQVGIAAGLLQFKRERTGKTFKVQQHFMTGRE